MIVYIFSVIFIPFTELVFHRNKLLLLMLIIFLPPDDFQVTPSLTYLALRNAMPVSKPVSRLQIMISAVVLGPVCDA